MEMLSYLVRHHFVVQLRTFGWLRLPKALLDPTTAPKEPLKRHPAARNSLLSPRTRPADDDVVSISSERTTIPSTPLSRQTRRTSHETQISHSGDSKQDEIHTLITNPHEPGEEQQMVLKALGTFVRDADLQEMLPRLILHLDGKSAFEELAAQEGWKRARVEVLLADIDSYLVTVRHE